jgi:hypothetical protein
MEENMVPKRFGVLRFIGGFYKVVGIIIAVITLLSALGFCLTSVLGTSILGGVMQQLGNGSSMPLLAGAGGVLAGVIGSLVMIIFGSIGALGLYAIGELIFLLIALEENTRVTSFRQ